MLQSTSPQFHSGSTFQPSMSTSHFGATEDAHRNARQPTSFTDSKHRAGFDFLNFAKLHESRQKFQPAEKVCRHSISILLCITIYMPSQSKAAASQIPRNPPPRSKASARMNVGPNRYAPRSARKKVLLNICLMANTTVIHEGTHERIADPKE